MSSSATYLSPGGNLWLISPIRPRTSCATFSALAPGSVYTFICAAFLPDSPENVEYTSWLSSTFAMSLIRTTAAVWLTSSVRAV